MAHGDVRWAQIREPGPPFGRSPASQSPAERRDRPTFYFSLLSPISWRVAPAHFPFAFPSSDPLPLRFRFRLWSGLFSFVCDRFRVSIPCSRISRILLLSIEYHSLSLRHSPDSRDRLRRVLVKISAALFVALLCLLRHAGSVLGYSRGRYSELQPSVFRRGPHCILPANSRESDLLLEPGYQSPSPTISPNSRLKSAKRRPLR